MHIVRNEDMTLFACDDLNAAADEFGDSVSPSTIEDLITVLCPWSFVLKRDVEERYGTYIARYAETTGLTGIGMLSAHGSDEDKPEGWTFWDGEQGKLVQQWVNEQDGKFACLICHVCNEGRRTVTAKRSLLVLPDTIVQGSFGGNEIGATSEGTETHFSLFHPSRGEITSYTLEYELALLTNTKLKK